MLAAYGTGSGLRGHAPGGGKGVRVTTMTYAVTGMTRGHCVHAVTAELSGLAGVSQVDVALVPGGAARVTVTSAAPLPGPAVAAALDEAGDYRLATA